MGCAASGDPKIGVSDSIKPVKTNSNDNKRQTANGGSKNNSKNNYSDPRNLPDTQNKPPLAFVISFDENNKNGELRRPPPGRLRLEPIQQTPKVTREDINEKLRSAELNREKILAERAKSGSRKRTSNNNSAYSSDRNDNDDRLRDEPNFYKNKSDSNSNSKFNGSNSNSKNGGEYERSQESKQRMLEKRRIVKQDDDSDIEHDRNYNRDDDDF